MNLKAWGIALTIMSFATTIFAQRNPNEGQLFNQVNGLKAQIIKIDTTIAQGDGKGKFSAAISDSLYKMQDYLMDLNDRLYWLTNKDSILNAPTEHETPTEEEKGMDGKSDGNIETDSFPPPPADFDLGKLMPKPKVKRQSYFFQYQNGAAFVLGQVKGTANTPEWKPFPLTNGGGTLIYALRLGKADLSKLKMEFNIKKKLTSSNFLKASPWQLRIGLGLQRYSIPQKTDYELNKDKDNGNVPVFSIKNNNATYQQNTLNLYYVHVPITVWRKLSSKSFIEAGGFVDILRKTSQTVVYKENDIQNTLTRKGDLGINKIAYGATASLGFNAASLYVNYHLSSLFAKNSTYDYNLMSIGIKLGY